MFRLVFLKLNYNDKNIEPTIYWLKESTYIYGPNNVGKTLFIQAIDFVLGNSDGNLMRKEGLENINSIETKLCVESSTLFLKRTTDNSFHYKLSENDEYFVVSEENYKDKITNFIYNGDKKFLKIFYDYTKENLSFRAFSFFNFIDEKGLGNTSSVFTRTKDYKHIVRSKELMTFIFNFENIEKLAKLKRRSEELAEELETYKVQVENYNYFLALIKNKMNSLNLPTDKDKSELEDIFRDYKNNYTRENETKEKYNGDLGYLLRVSYTLSENIKYQKYLKVQSNKFISSKANAIKMLNFFKSISEIDNEYDEYVNHISELIEEELLEKDIIKITDHDKIIEDFIIKKDKIDKQIESLLNGLNKKDYEETIKTIGVIEQYFVKLNNCIDYELYEKKQKEYKKLLDDISFTNKLFTDSLKNKFDEKILKLYSELKGKPNFATDDFSKLNFKILFDPINCSLSGARALDPTKLEELYSYNPGSMARETTWQILAYLVMFEILLENFKELPFMRLLVIDGMYQPFDDNNESYPSVFQLVQKKSKELGIQLIVVSTKYGIGEPINAEYQIDLSTGFNKMHNK